MQKKEEHDFFDIMMRLRKLSSGLVPACSVQITELTVMRKVCDENGCTSKTLTVSDLHSCLHVSKPALSQMLNSLEKRGYITRQIDTIDRRKISVETTPEGAAILEETALQYEHLFTTLCQRFGAQELCNLVQQLEAFADVYEDIQENWG